MGVGNSDNGSTKKRKIDDSASTSEDDPITAPADSKKIRNEDNEIAKDTPSEVSIQVSSASHLYASKKTGGNASGSNSPVPHVDATFDGKKWDWIDEFPKAEIGITTFIGPFLHDAENPESDLVGEVEAIAMWEMMTTLQKMGYLCPNMAVPVTFNLDDHYDYYDEKDYRRLQSLPLGVQYLMLRDDPEKEIAVHTNDGIFCGNISHYGVPPNHTWLRLRVNSKSTLAQNFIPALESTPFENNKFAFARFVHKRDDITDKKYLTTENPFVNEKDLRLFVETGLVENALTTMFTVQKGKDAVAKSLVNYRTSAGGGPNILQIEVAKEWQARNILTWLLVCIEDFYVHKFSRCLLGNPELLRMTAVDIAPTEKGRDGKEEQNFLTNRGYGGHDNSNIMSKPLMFKLIKHDLKTSLDTISSRNGAAEVPQEKPKPPRPLDPRLGFISQRAQDMANRIAYSIPDNVLPGMVVALTRAAMDPIIPEINKPPALFTKSRKAHTREVSKSIAEAVVEALPKDRSRGSSSDGSNSGKPGKTAVVEEVSDALVRKMVEAIPEKRELAAAMVEASSELDIQYDTIEKAKAVVATASEEGSTSSAEREESEEVKKKKEDLVEAVVEALPDAEVDIDNIASNIDEKELAEVSIVKETSAGMGLSGALADAVTKVIPDRALPEVAVAMTQAVLQEIPDTEAMDSKYSVPTATERGPGALANSVLNVVPDKIVPEVAVALTEAVMDAVPEDALGGKKLENPVPDAPSASEVLAETVLKSVPNELVSEVAVALTKKVIGKIPEKDMSVSSTCGSKGSRK